MRCDRQYCAHRARILDQQKEGRCPAPLQTSLCSRWQLLVRHETCPTRHPRRTLPGKKSVRVSKHADLGSKGAPLRECHKVCRTRDGCKQPRASDETEKGAEDRPRVRAELHIASPHPMHLLTLSCGFGRATCPWGSRPSGRGLLERCSSPNKNTRLLMLVMQYD